MPDVGSSSRGIIRDPQNYDDLVNKYRQKEANDTKKAAQKLGVASLPDAAQQYVHTLYAQRGSPDKPITEPTHHSIVALRESLSREQQAVHEVGTKVLSQPKSKSV